MDLLLSKATSQMIKEEVRKTQNHRCSFYNNYEKWSNSRMKMIMTIELKDTSVELTEHNQIYSSKHVLVTVTRHWLAFISSHIMTTSDWVCIWLVRTPHLGWFWHDCSWVIFKKKNKRVTMILWYETRKENLVSRRCLQKMLFRKKVIYFVLSFRGIFEMMSTK